MQIVDADIRVSQQAVLFMCNHVLETQICNTASGDTTNSKRLPFMHSQLFGLLSCLVNVHGQGHMLSA